MELEQGSSHSFYATFVDLEGKAVEILSSAIVMKHIYGGNTTIDIDNAQMTQLEGPTYYYTYNIARNADLGKYAVKYIGKYSDGTVAVGAEDVQVIPRGAFEKTRGGTVRGAVRKDTWLPSEKDELMQMIKDLYTGISTVSKLSDCVNLMNAEIVSTKELVASAKPVEVSVDLSELSTKLSNLESVIKKSVEDDKEQDTIVPVIANPELSIKIDELYSKMNSISVGLKEINNRKPDVVHDQRVSLLITELEDLNKQVDIIGKVVIKLLPRNKIESVIKDEYDRGAVERIQAESM